jgi:nitrogen fixation/metabolism regulation signal transduction histidine kinase
MLAESGLGENSPIYGFVLGQRKMVFFFFSLGFLVSIFASVAWGIYFSHKIAGPLYRLKKHLNETAAGKAAQPLKFRTGDYFQEIADAYNAELVSRGKLKRWGSAPERAYREGKA